VTVICHVVDESESSSYKTYRPVDILRGEINEEPLEYKAYAEENNLLNVVMEGLREVNRLAELMS